MQEELLKDIQSRLKTIECMLKSGSSTPPTSSDKVLPGYLPIKEAWRKCCQIVTYEIYREFIDTLPMPTKPLTLVKDGHLVHTKQVKVENVHKLKAHILIYAVRDTQHYFKHRDISKRFLLRN